MLTDQSRQNDFPSLSGCSYLNTAAEGIPPRQVLAALAQYGQDKLLGMDGRILHGRQRDLVCQETAHAFGLTAEEIGVCSCASEAFQLAAAALGLSEADEVVINDLDFPAGATPWMQPGCAATVKVWRSRQGMLHIEDLVSLLTPQTKVVSTSLVSFYNGFKIDLPALADAVHRHSPALVAVDVTQALGRMVLDLSQADLIVSATHKWILGSHGGGLVGVPQRCADRFTAQVGGWFHLENAFDADRFERVMTKQGAASFSTGMPNYPAIYAVAAALTYLRGIGIDRIESQCEGLVMACLSGLQELGVKLISPQSPDRLAGILAFTHPRAEEINRRLHEQNIHIMSHAGRLRVSIHGYNTQEDIDSLISNLRLILNDVGS